MSGKKNVLRTAVLLLFLCQCVTSLNILGIFPYQGKSHFMVYQTYLQELAKKGHNVTVISHFPQRSPPSNYNDISLAGSVQTFEDEVPFTKSYRILIYTGLFLINAGRENCRVMLANTQVQELVARKSKFDVVVTEQFNSDCALGVAYKLQAPVVGLTSNILMPWHYDRFGIPYNPAYVPFHFLGGGTKPTLFQRVERTIFGFYFKTLFHIYGQISDQNTLAQYFDDIPPLETLARQTKFLLVYHNLVLTGSRNFPANVIEVGGYHVSKAKPITGDLKKFIEDAEHGIIYISFGSLIKSSTMPEDKVAAVVGAIENLPQRFIWKWENNALLVNKNKLYISSWLPQVDILGHPKTVAFLSHAGMGGTTEAIHYGVPMVAMPIIGDQPSNAAAVEESGLGVQIQIEDLTKDNLLTAFKRVLDPKFRENVKQISEAWHDRPLSPMDTAVFWTEFAARYSNFSFTSAAANVPTYQYWNLDIIAILTTVLLVLVYVSMRILNYCCSSKTKKLDQKAKIKQKRKTN